MIKSMTGFGKAICELPGKKITVEIRSLNSKQLDINLRIPSLYREKEPDLRTEISRQCERGKIDFSIFSESPGDVTGAGINRETARHYYRELKALADEFNEQTDRLLPLVIQLPDIFKSERQDLDSGEWKEVKTCTDKALKEFNRFRTDEGRVLEEDLAGRIEVIMKLLDEVKLLDEKRIPAVRERLLKNLTGFKEKLDQNRLEQELIYYIEKLDITEEKVRLLSHCKYFIKTMKEESSGRKLGFIGQEIGREINTIGSKANDAKMQKAVVQMKDELEKIKEQLNNVL